MDELLTQINNLYGLKLTYFDKVAKGFLSENHVLIEGNKKYFLKKYRFSEKEKIEEIHSAKKYFASGGIPVILPLVNNKSKTFFIFDDRYYALFPFMEGKQLERGKATDAEIVSLGETLGRIHLLGKKATLPINEQFKGWNRDKALEKIESIRLEINKKDELSGFDKIALENFETKKNLILRDEVIYEDLNLPNDHLTHGDYADQNVFFGPDERVSAVFDFEKVGYAPRIYELIKSFMYSFFDEEINSENKRRVKLYLNSYFKIYPVSRDEMERGIKLYVSKMIHSTWVEGEHYLKNNNRVDVFLASDFMRMKYFSENFDELKNYLLELAI